MFDGLIAFSFSSSVPRRLGDYNQPSPLGALCFLGAPHSLTLPTHFTAAASAAGMIFSPASHSSDCACQASHIGPLYPFSPCPP